VVALSYRADINLLTICYRLALVFLSINDLGYSHIGLLWNSMQPAASILDVNFFVYAIQQTLDKK
jgi:hypothetical protein